jgi:hypothetical protein
MVGPIFHFAQYVNAVVPPEQLPEPGPERIAIVLADGGRRSFDTHPDLQEIAVFLRGWYDE